MTKGVKPWCGKQCLSLGKTKEKKAWGPQGFLILFPNIESNVFKCTKS